MRIRVVRRLEGPGERGPTIGITGAANTFVPTASHHTHRLVNDRRATGTLRVGLDLVLARSSAHCRTLPSWIAFRGWTQCSIPQEPARESILSKVRFLDAESCTAMFCHSQWYADLIRGPYQKFDSHRRRHGIQTPTSAFSIVVAAAE